MAEMTVAWMVDMKADTMAGMMAESTADTKVALTVDMKADMMVAWMVG